MSTLLVRFGSGYVVLHTESFIYEDVVARLTRYRLSGICAFNLNVNSQV